jgi:hypothetical protein
VIGNAAVLRVPRDQRNLDAIALALHARFIVLGQVQRSGSQTRVLAHLIRMPEQTHVWVCALTSLSTIHWLWSRALLSRLPRNSRTRGRLQAAKPNLHSSSTNR